MFYLVPVLLGWATAAAITDPALRGTSWRLSNHRLVSINNDRSLESSHRTLETLDDAEVLRYKWFGHPPDTSRYPFPNILLYPKPSCTPDVKVVAAVLTKPSDFAMRDRLRQIHNEIGGNRIRVIFPVGRSTLKANGDSIDAKIIREVAKYGDILLADYDDSYEELPQKTISAMAWFSKSCPDAPYFVKIDDDTIVNWMPLLTFLSIVERQGFTRWDNDVVDAAKGEFWTGRRWDGMPVVKDPAHRNSRGLRT